MTLCILCLPPYTTFLSLPPLYFAHRMADVFRHILALNDSAVLELLISDEMYMGLAGALEYDSLLGEQAQYRQYISSPEHLKIVMPGLSYANKSGQSVYALLLVLLLILVLYINDVHSLIM